jgi:glycosyltransferase involved in cell wall biosynthesis
MSIGTNPVVSVIVPGRNEEACLAACLDSLITQTGISYEIIVVDDDSTDRTAEIASSFASPDSQGLARGREPLMPEVTTAGEGTALAVPQSSHFDVGGFSPRVTVIPAPLLPDNWTGKNNAMSAGARAAHTKAKWLLFTDADTVHRPGSLARAVAEAEQHGAALLSYSPQQEVHGFWEKAVMPVIFAELATTYPPQAVNDPASPIAAANGQYLMISREAYDAVGGHATIAGDLLEDVALARLVKRSGRKLFFRYAADAVRTRMYRSFAQLREGWTKNLALLFPKPIELAQSRLGELVVLLVVPLMFVRSAYWTTFSSVLHPAWFKWYVPAMEGFTLVAFVLCAADFLQRMRRAHFSSWSIIWGFFGLPIFAYLLLRSERAYKKSRFEWKDRTYVYTPEEVKALSAARFSVETPSTWRRLTGWISNIGRT